MSLVYSTDTGRMCPACRQPADRCTCRATPVVSAFPDGTVRVSRETKGRAGKVVTLIKGLGLADPEITSKPPAAPVAPSRTVSSSSRGTMCWL